jgi:hypothetical protein
VSGPTDFPLVVAFKITGDGTHTRTIGVPVPDTKPETITAAFTDVRHCMCPGESCHLDKVTRRHKNKVIL